MAQRFCKVFSGVFHSCRVSRSLRYVTLIWGHFKPRCDVSHFLVPVFLLIPLLVHFGGRVLRGIEFLLDHLLERLVVNVILYLFILLFFLQICVSQWLWRILLQRVFTFLQVKIKIWGVLRVEGDFPRARCQVLERLILQLLLKPLEFLWLCAFNTPQYL